MKAKASSASSIVLGVVAVAVALYLYMVFRTPKTKMDDTQEGFEDWSAGKIIGLVVLCIAGIGLIFFEVIVPLMGRRNPNYYRVE